MNLRRTLTEDVGIKVMAVVVAAFIWFNASGQQQVVRLREIPLVPRNLPDSLVVTTPLPARVEVRVTGTRRQILALGFRRVQGVLDLGGLGPGHHRITLSSANVELPNGFDRRNITVISPLAVDLTLERRVMRRIMVELTRSNELSKDLVAVGEGLRVEPEWVTVRGPESTVMRMRSVPTKPFDLSRVRESVEREVDLDFDPELVECDPAVVKVYATVERRERRGFNVPPTVLIDDRRLDYSIHPPTISLTVEGPKSIVDTLTTAGISVVVQPPRAREGTLRLAPEVIVPDGTQVVKQSIDSFTVRIVPAQDDAEP